MLLVSSCGATNGDVIDPVKEEIRKTKIEEFNKLLNCNEFTAKIALYINASSQTVEYYYRDNDIIQERIYNSNRLVTTLTTKNSSYISGGGYNICKDADNTALIDEPTFDVSEYTVEVIDSADSSFLIFNLDFKGIVENVGFFGSSMDSLLREYGINIDNVYIQAFYDDNNKITELDCVFDDVFHAINPGIIMCRLCFETIKYGDSFRKRTISFDGYHHLDAKTYDTIALSILYFQQAGTPNVLEFVSKFGETVFENRIPEDLLLGYICPYGATEAEALKYIYARDTEYTYDITTPYVKCKFSYLDHEFVIQVPIKYTTAFINRLDDSYTIDMENNRVLVELNGKCSVIDTNTLETIKEIEVEGEISRIITHKDVYHLIAITEFPEQHQASYYYRYKSVIYVIDKTTLEIIESIKLNTCAYNTQIDKRGDIIFASGNMTTYINGQSEVSVYNHITKGVKFICTDDYTHYVDYNEEKDTFAIFPLVARFDLSYYKYDSKENYKYQNIDIQNIEYVYNVGDVLYQHNGYLITSGGHIINTRNEKKPFDYDTNMREVQCVFAKGEENVVYMLGRYNYNKHFGLAKIDFSFSPHFQIKFYQLEDLFSEYYYCFAKGDNVYCYSLEDGTYHIIDTTKLTH